MAVSPSSATLATWLGTGAATTSPAAATAGYYIPAANVGGYLGAAGNTAVSDDVRDFLHSTLSKITDKYNEPRASADTSPSTFSVTRSLVSQSDGKYQVIYTVAINNIVNVPTSQLVVDALPTFG